MMQIVAKGPQINASYFIQIQFDMDEMNVL